jgi:hypothetical protein
VVVAGIEQFIKSLKRQTALVIDNAPIHTSNAFNSNIEKWAQQGNHRPHCPLFPRA